jgi:hypothetical protein
VRTDSHAIEVVGKPQDVQQIRAAITRKRAKRTTPDWRSPDREFP